MKRCRRRKGAVIGTFEYITALLSVVVGLAVADMATSLHRLMRKRRQVRWHWVAPLSAIVILIELFNLWWNWRNFQGNTLADVAPYLLALVLLFLTAAATLPDEVPEDGIDLGRYFDDNRAYFWALYASYLTVWIGLGTARRLARGDPFAEVWDGFYLDYASILVFFALIFVRPRWISGAALLASLYLILVSYGWWTKPLAAP